MPSILDKCIMFVGLALEATFIVCSLWRGVFRRFLYLNIWCLCLILGSFIRQTVLSSYGISSVEYFYTFYVVDFYLSVATYMAILSVLDIILRDSEYRTMARVAFVCCFAGIAIVSYYFISGSLSHLYTRYVLEFQQNTKFASVVLTCMLGATLAHLRVKDPQVRIIVAGMGVLAGIQAAAYALQNMIHLPPHQSEQVWAVLRRVIPFATLAALTFWNAAIIRVPVLGRVSEPSQNPVEPVVEPPELVRDAGSRPLVPVFMSSRAKN